MRFSPIVRVIVLLAVLSTRGLAADGDLDPTFGTQGKVAHTNPMEVRSIVVQGDGRIVLAGRATVSGEQDFGLLRYESDGSVDASFGAGGSVVTGVPGNAGIARALLQSDGRIIVVGWSFATDFDTVIARYEPDGALDPTYGTGGIVTVPGAEPDAVLQADGKLVVVASSSVVFPFTGDIVVMRFDTDGSPDTAFGSGGVVTTDLGPLAVPRSVALESDGDIVVGGAVLSSSGAIILRYLSDGTPDATFGSGGMVTVAPYPSVVFGLIVQPTGAIVAGVRHDNGGTLYRFGTSGMPDVSFGTSGSAGVPLDIPSVLRAQPDGKLLIAGAIAHSNAVVRYDADGQFDPSLSSCGAALTAVEGDLFYYGTLALAVQPDGRFLVSSQMGSDLNDPYTESFPMLVRFGTPGTAACTSAPTGRSRLRLKNFTAKWKWTGSATLADFGTPDLGTDHTLCLVDPASGKPWFAVTLPGTTAFCSHDTCWQPRSSGFTGVRSGIEIGKIRMKLIAADGGTGRLTVTNKHESPYQGIDPPSPYPLPVTARLKRGDGLRCWEATYSTAEKNSVESGLFAFSD